MPHDVRMPDGTIIRNVPDGTTKADLQRRYAQHAQQNDTRPSSFFQGFTDEITKAGTNAAYMIGGYVNPVGSALQSLSDLTGIGADYTPRAFYQKQRQSNDAASAKSKYQGSTAGKIAGGVVATLPTMMIPGGVLAQGAAQGLLSTRNLDDARGVATDAAIGAVGGKVGEVVGKRLVAPVVERLGRTKVGRAVSLKAFQAANAVLAQLPGRARVSPLPLPVITPGERIVGKAAPKMNEARKALEDAARLKLPFALADASPELRTLAGSVSRKSNDANALAERTFAPRARGQADRLVAGIDERLAPITKINERAQSLIDDGRPVYNPLYEQAYAASPITSPRLQQTLATPAGREATGRASTIAANEFRDPRAMGFAVDDAGNTILHSPPVQQMDRIDAARQGWDSANAAYEDALRRQQASLTPSQFSQQVADARGALAMANSELDTAKAGIAAAPRSGTVQESPQYTTQSLDYVKRGIDDILEPQRNLITGKLNLDEGGRAILGVKNALINEVDTLNPAYGDARAAYAKFAKQGEALRTGHEVLPQSGVPERDFQAVLSRYQEHDAALPTEFAEQTTVPELARGYATNMADQADKMRVTGNPYEAVYGAPLQQKKVAALFPEGSDDFARQYELESQMSKTAWETLGGSPTQRRAMADQLFDNNIAQMGVSALSAASSPKWAAAKAILQKAQDTMRTRGEARANELAPVLFNTDNPQAGADYISDLMRKNAEMQFRKDAYRKAGGLFGSPAGAAAVGLFGSG